MIVYQSKLVLTIYGILSICLITIDMAICQIEDQKVDHVPIEDKPITGKIKSSNTWEACIRLVITKSKVNVTKLCIID